MLKLFEILTKAGPIDEENSCDDSAHCHRNMIVRTVIATFLLIDYMVPKVSASANKEIKRSQEESETFE